MRGEDMNDPGKGVGKVPSSVDYENFLESDDWIPYSKRPDWKDVTPLPIKETDDNNLPIVRIAYSDRFKEVYDYLRAIIAKEEISQRAFELTTDAVLANPANYSAWYYRRQLIKEMGLDLKLEREFISQVILANPKNYQVWEHRRVLIEWLQDISDENRFLRFVFDQDNKNYHAWQYRQWYVVTFKRFDQEELEFVDSMIAKDVRNNSAWNHRFFVIRNQNNAAGDDGNVQGFANPAVKERELQYCLRFLTVCTDNESAWNYLRGILDDSSFSSCPDVVAFCWHKYMEGCRDVFLLEMLMEITAEEIKTVYNDTHRLDDKRMETYQNLADELIASDPIRVKYWTFVRNEFLKSLRQVA